MTGQVHEFEAREGGSFRISLSYQDPGRTGKSAAHTDTYHGHFAKLVPNEQVVEGIPDGVPAADNATGTRMALANLANLVEASEGR
jgi:hypothetical protein